METHVDPAVSTGSSPTTPHRLHPREWHSREVTQDWVILHCAAEADDEMYLYRCRGFYPDGKRCRFPAASPRDTLCAAHLDQDGRDELPEGGPR